MSEGHLPDNVVQLLFESVKKYGPRTAFVSGQQSVNFSELWLRIARASHGLLEHGFGSRDRAIVMVPMSSDLYVILMAVLKVGGVAAFLDPWVGFRQLVALAKFAEAQAFIGTTKSHILRLADRNLRKIRLSVSPTWSLVSGVSLEKLEKSSPLDDIHAHSGTNTALITFTTGSSGTPKGVIRSHHILGAQHRALAAEFPAIDGDVDLCTFPVFALNNLALGVTTVIPSVDIARIASADGAVLADEMTRHRVTTATASPPLFDALAASGRQVKLRRILTGGAPVTDEQLRNWKAAFPETEIHVVYGSTEAEPVAHITADERLRVESRAGYLTGTMTRWVDAAVVQIAKGPLDGSTTEAWDAIEMPQGEIGELVVTGDHVCREYDRNPEAVRDNKILDHSRRVWHRMGDTGYFDAEKRFWLVGRVHSTIVREGRMMHAQQLEQIARGDDPLIQRLAVVGMPHTSLGERVVLVIESGSKEAGGTARQRLVDAGWPVDEVIVTAAPLPLDPRHNSKIDYSQLRELLQDRRLR